MIFSNKNKSMGSQWEPLTKYNKSISIPWVEQPKGSSATEGVWENMQINIKYDDRHYEHIGHEEQQKDEKVDMNDLFSAKAYKKFLHPI